MKRAQQSPSPPSNKRAKVGNQGLVQADDDTGEWTKVDKRKAKKSKKSASKFDANPPRFMYVNGEIVKRKEAVRIEVCTLKRGMYTAH